MRSALKVAFFPDCYFEIDGVGNTARQFEAYARRHQRPFLLVHGGYENRTVADSKFTRLECKRTRLSFAVDKKHDFDLLFLQHYPAVARMLRAFQPDVVHITGPSDVGILGALLAHRLGIPLVGSWHTNLHEYAEQRAIGLVPFLPGSLRRRLGAGIREGSLSATARYYRIPRVLMAPNPELIELLQQRTCKPCYLMARGVDTVLFDPRRRRQTDGLFTIGYVGRLTIEKNIGLLADLEKILLAAGASGFRFLIAGQGAGEPWLRQNLRNAEFAGVRHGEDLAAVYANMDVFVFPSRTDTFGNVVLEAMASGVPAVVTDSGGPQFIVREGETGFVAQDVTQFARYIQRLMENPWELERMRTAAREQALATSWDSIFEAVYRAYEIALRLPRASHNKVDACARQSSIPQVEENG